MFIGESFPMCLLLELLFLSVMRSKVHLLIVGLHLLGTTAFLDSCPVGQQRQKGKCIDVNECIQEIGICGADAACYNTFGSYYCNCQDGFESRSHLFNFTAITGSCIDKNECLEHKGICGPNAACQNTIGSFRCSCLEGYARDQNTTCEDIDECLVNAATCGQLGSCENKDGGHRCHCSAGSSNFGDEQAPCIELKCELYKADGKQTLPSLESILSLMRNSCLELSQTSVGVGQMDGEKLLENVLAASDNLLSNESLEQSIQMSKLLDSMENAIRLIAPQLRQNETRMVTHHAEVELLVRRKQTPPHGPLHLFTEHVQLDTTWETAAGTSKYPGFAVASIVTYKDLESQMNSSAHRMGEEGSGVNFQMNSKVVTVYVSNPDTSHLPTPVRFTFSHLRSQEADHTCVYWDTSRGDGIWSPQGCMTVESNATHTICSCNHLSSFAVLMALYEIKDTFQLQMITWLGLSLSLVCLFLCILTFSCCRSIQCTRNTIHLHLCICLFIADLVFLAGISSTDNRHTCGFVAGLLHYFFLATFCWMCLEGVQLYRMVVLVFNTTLKPLYMLAVGYGLPLLIVAVSAIARAEGYGTKQHCWLSLEKGFIWSFFGPVSIIIIINVFFFIVTVWKLADKFNSLNPDMSNLRKIRTFTVTAIAQLCILGTMWIFGFFQFDEHTIAMSYLFTILNSLQGVLIFIMHCLLSKQVREEYARFLSCVPSKRQRKEKYSESSSSQALRMTQSTGESQA